MAVLYTDHFVQFFDDNGNPLSGGKLFAYSAGTTTPKATFTTEEATVENSNPIILDSAGRATIFIEGSYRFDLFDANDVLIKSTDDVTSFTTLNEAGEPFFQSFSGTGSQTVFTLSEALGTDSKNLMVFVDAGGNEGYEIQNPSAYTLSGTALTFNSAPASGTDNIYVFAPTKLLGEAAASAAAAAASEAAAAASEAAAAASETDAATIAGTLVIESTTSVAIGTGTKSFTVDSGLSIEAGQFVLITSDANPTVNKMFGEITSYSSTTLEVDVVYTEGTGSYNDWTFRLTGPRGEQGAAGIVTAASGVQASASGGASLISSGGNDCLTWGNGGGAALELDVNMSGQSTYKLVNMIDPTSPQDYTTKAYVDSTKNLVVDGATEIFPDGTALSSLANDTYVCGLMRYVKSGSGVHNANKDTTTTLGDDSSSSLRITTATADASLGAGDYYAIETLIEGTDMLPAAFGTASAQGLALTFTVRASVAGTYCVVFKNSANSRGYIVEYTINAINTDEEKTVLIDGDTAGTWVKDSGVGLRVAWGLGVGSARQGAAGSWINGDYFGTSNQTNITGTLNSLFYITNIKLSVGTVATPFERLPIALEQERFARYYQKGYDDDVAPGAVGLNGRLACSSTGTAAASATVMANFGTRMRAAPTVTLYNPATGTAGQYRTGAGGNVAATANNIGQSGFNAQNSAVTTDNLLHVTQWVADARF